MVSLQVNSEIRIKTIYMDYNVELGTSTLLASSTYKIDDKYDIAQSCLYSVIAVDSEYIIISESNKTLVNITLCHKNRPILTSS